MQEKIKTNLDKWISDNAEKYYTYRDKIYSENVKYILDEMFTLGHINQLTHHELEEYFRDIKSLCISDNDEELIHKIFKECDNKHYYNTEYGFIIFLNITSLSLENKKKIRMNKEKTYLFRNTLTNSYKIGMTTCDDVTTRLKQIRVGAEVELIGYTNKNIEKILHKKYTHCRVHGEWFDLSEKEVSEILDVFKAEFEIDDEVSAK